MQGGAAISCQHALGARDATCVAGDGFAQRDAERLEASLRLVVVVLALEDVDVQRDARRRREGLEDVGDHLRAQLAHFLAVEVQRDLGAADGSQCSEQQEQGRVQRPWRGSEHRIGCTGVRDSLGAR